MDFLDFAGGFGPGVLTEVYEIKILICYLLDNVKYNFTKDDLDYIFKSKNIVSYFGYCQAFADLLKDGHFSEVEQEGKKVLTLNELGKDTTRHLAKGLPKSARDKVVKAAMELLALKKHDSEVKSSIKQVYDGYIVDCTIKDIGSDLLKLEIYAPDLIQANIIKEQFYNKTSDVFQGIVALFTNNSELLRDIADKLEEKKED